LERDGMASHLVGFIDRFEPTLSGWLIDQTRPAQPAFFTVTIDRSQVFGVFADRPRPDVAAAGYGGPNCGFELALPLHLADGAPHAIEFALADGEGFTLPGGHSPIVLGRVAAVIAPLTFGDAAAAEALLRQTHIESGVDPAALTVLYVASWLAMGSEAVGGLLFGAWSRGALVGYALLERGRGLVGPIGAVSLSVLQTYRRKGIGERLMRALLAAVARRGDIRAVWLSVQPENLPARQLYEKLGFVVRTEPPLGMQVPLNYLSMVWLPDGFGD
jgi:ribosomal protein S18 acetylase RimI-like enzyme